MAGSTSPGQTCSTCVFWERQGPQLAGAESDPSCPPTLGTCLFAPPTIATSTGFFPMSVWPRTHQDKWCGGWETNGEVGGPDGGEEVDPVVTPFRRAAA